MGKFYSQAQAQKLIQIKYKQHEAASQQAAGVLPKAPRKQPQTHGERKRGRHFMSMEEDDFEDGDDEESSHQKVPRRSWATIATTVCAKGKDFSRAGELMAMSKKKGHEQIRGACHYQTTAHPEGMQWIGRSFPAGTAPAGGAYSRMWGPFVADAEVQPNMEVPIVIYLRKVNDDGAFEVRIPSGQKWWDETAFSGSELEHEEINSVFEFIPPPPGKQPVVTEPETGGAAAEAENDAETEEHTENEAQAENEDERQGGSSSC